MNLSNALTLLRVVLLFPMAWCLNNDYGFAATIILIIAAISDGLDGYFARKWKQESAFGKLMDPIADKIFVCVSFILLVADPLRQLNPYLVSILLAREFFVSGLRSLYASKGIILGPDKSAKWKTTFQFIGIGGLLLYRPLLPFLPSSADIGNIALLISLVLSYWSMNSYIKKFQHLM